MKKIDLGQGHCALVDDADFDRVAQYTWNLQRNKITLYGRRTVYDKGINLVILLHRFIVDAAPGDLVDHKSRDGLDCRRANLRICNKSQNGANSKRRDKDRTSSQFRGVCLVKNLPEGRARWLAYITKDKKRRSLGVYYSEKDAALAFNKAASELFGEFASLNKVIVTDEELAATEKMRSESRTLTAQSRKKQVGSTSRFKGVAKVGTSPHRPWLAYIWYDNKLHKLGTFEHESDAALAYNVAAKEHFGDHARFNTV